MPLREKSTCTRMSQSTCGVTQSENRGCCFTRQTAHHIYTANWGPLAYTASRQDGLDEKGMGWHSFKRFRKTWLRGARCLEDINNGPQAEDDVGNLLASSRGVATAPRRSRARRLRLHHSEILCCCS